MGRRRIRKRDSTQMCPHFKEGSNVIHLPWTCRDESELVTIRRADIPRLSTLNANYTARQMLEMYDEVVAQGATQVVMVVSKYKVRK